MKAFLLSLFGFSAALAALAFPVFVLGSFWVFGTTGAIVWLVCLGALMALSVMNFRKQRWLGKSFAVLSVLMLLCSGYLPVWRLAEIANDSRADKVFCEGCTENSRAGLWKYRQNGAVVWEMKLEDTGAVYRPEASPRALMAVQKGGLWGFIDRKGKLIVPIEHTHLSPYFLDENDLASVGKDGLIGFVDLSGNMVVKPQFTEVGRYNPFLTQVKTKEGKWGYMKKSGELAIPARYDDASDFVKVSDAGRFLAITNVSSEGCFLIDGDGKAIAGPFSRCHTPMPDDEAQLLAMQDKASGLFGYMKLTGAWAIAPKFNHVSLKPISSKKAIGNATIGCGSIGGKFSVISPTGAVLVHEKYDECEEATRDDPTIVGDVKYGGKRYWLHEDGRETAAPQ